MKAILSAVPGLLIVLLAGCNVGNAMSEPDFHVAEPPKVVFDADPGAWGTDTFEYISGHKRDGVLTATVSYRGGCQGHDFTLVVFQEEIDPNWEGRYFVKATLVHNSNGDPCDRIITDAIEFDLSQIESRARTSLGTDKAGIDLRLVEGTDRVDYFWYGIGGYVAGC